MYLWGYVGVNTIVQKLRGEPVDTIILMELERVTRENLGEWARQLQEWGFSDVPAEYLSR